MQLSCTTGAARSAACAVHAHVLQNSLGDFRIPVFHHTTHEQLADLGRARVNRIPPDNLPAVLMTLVRSMA
jgi:hypothetical protein